jgi:hypothetical protein
VLPRQQQQFAEDDDARRGETAQCGSKCRHRGQDSLPADA